MMAIDDWATAQSRRAASAMLLALAGSATAIADQAGGGIQGAWRFTHALPAPWGEALPGSPELTGQTLRVSVRAITGPRPFACGGLHGQLTHLPAEGLFQGVLPAPAGSAAQALGLGRFPVATSSLSCSSGLFDFHHADPDTILIGLDNRVWTLSRAPGAIARAYSPEGVVERFLEAHFGGEMGFDRQALAPKLAFLSARLQQSIGTYLARPQPEDEVPAINGDPFTDSQEYPTRFAVRRARPTDGGSEVEVVFSDAGRRASLIYRLVRESGAWRLDDIAYPGGDRLRGQLR